MPQSEASELISHLEEVLIAADSGGFAVVSNTTLGEIINIMRGRGQSIHRLENESVKLRAQLRYARAGNTARFNALHRDWEQLMRDRDKLVADAQYYRDRNAELRKENEQKHKMVDELITTIQVLRVL